MKKSMLLFFTAAAVALTAMTGCATTSGTQKTTQTSTKEAESEKEADLQKQNATKYITVDMKSNPTTGGSWKISIADESIAKLESRTYTQDETDSPRVGVGGTESFGFKCLKKGSTTVKFTYGQMWEGGSIWETKTAVITVNENQLGTIEFK